MTEEELKSMGDIIPIEEDMKRAGDLSGLLFKASVDCITNDPDEEKIGKMADTFLLNIIAEFTFIRKDAEKSALEKQNNWRSDLENMDKLANNPVVVVKNGKHEVLMSDDVALETNDFGKIVLWMPAPSLPYGLK